MQFILSTACVDSRRRLTAALDRRPNVKAEITPTRPQPPSAWWLGSECSSGRCGKQLATSPRQLHEPGRAPAAGPPKTVDEMMACSSRLPTRATLPAARHIEMHSPPENRASECNARPIPSEVDERSRQWGGGPRLSHARPRVVQELHYCPTVIPLLHQPTLAAFRMRLPVGRSRLRSCCPPPLLGLQAWSAFPQRQPSFRTTCAQTFLLG